jgi:hypothetical protein
MRPADGRAIAVAEAHADEAGQWSSTPGDGPVTAGWSFQLIFSWIWMLLGLLGGVALGVGFHRDNWLGGYMSLRRRLYRLAHIV